MEEIINQLPKYIEVTPNKKTGEIYQAGLCLKYVSVIGKWVVRYGSPGSTKHILAKDLKYNGVGDTIIEALNDFVAKMKDAK